MAYNLNKKMKELEFERKQVLHHLALLDANIETLKQAIAISQLETDVTLYNTENFVYRRCVKLFKGKIRKYILQILRDNQSKAFTISELTQVIFNIEKNSDKPSERHFDAIRKQLNKFYQDNLIERIQVSLREVRWKWKTK